MRNTKLKAARAEKEGIRTYLAPLEYCGDNAAMIGCQGYYEYLSGVRAGSSLNAYATMSPDSTLCRF